MENKQFEYHFSYAGERSDEMDDLMRLLNSIAECIDEDLFIDDEQLAQQ